VDGEDCDVSAASPLIQMAAETSQSSSASCFSASTFTQPLMAEAKGGEQEVLAANPLHGVAAKTSCSSPCASTHVVSDVTSQEEAQGGEQEVLAANPLSGVAAKTSCSSPCTSAQDVTTVTLCDKSTADLTLSRRKIQLLSTADLPRSAVHVVGTPPLSSSIMGEIACLAFEYKGHLMLSGSLQEQVNLKMERILNSSALEARVNSFLASLEKFDPGQGEASEETYEDPSIEAENAEYGSSAFSPFTQRLPYKALKKLRQLCTQEKSVRYPTTGFYTNFLRKEILTALGCTTVTDFPKWFKEALLCLRRSQFTCVTDKGMGLAFVDKHTTYTLRLCMLQSDDFKPATPVDEWVLLDIKGKFELALVESKLFWVDNGLWSYIRNFCKLKVTAFNIPVLHEILKVHKVPIVLRPVIDCQGSLIEVVASFLELLLKQHVQERDQLLHKPDRFLLDLISVVEGADLQPGDDMTFVVTDVKSAFTKIKHHHIKQAIYYFCAGDPFLETIKKLLALVLAWKTFVVFQGQGKQFLIRFPVCSGDLLVQDP